MIITFGIEPESIMETVDAHWHWPNTDNGSLESHLILGIHDNETFGILVTIIIAETIQAAIRTVHVWIFRLGFNVLLVPGILEGQSWTATETAQIAIRLCAVQDLLHAQDCQIAGLLEILALQCANLLMNKYQDIYDKLCTTLSFLIK